MAYHVISDQNYIIIIIQSGTGVVIDQPVLVQSSFL